MNTTVEDWKLQASIKVGANQQHMINVRALTVDELCQLLDNLNGAAGFIQGSIDSIANGPVGESTVQAQAEASIRRSFPETQQVSSYGSQPQTYGQKPSAPECSHGPMRYKEGISKTGKRYKANFCSGPQGQQQCPPIFLD